MRGWVIFGVFLFACGDSKAPEEQQRFDVVEQSIAELGAALEDGTTTSEELVGLYLLRIDALDGRVRALASFDAAQAESAARELDAERRESGPRGPLHGIPILVKDSIDVAGLRTGGGTLVLADSMPNADAFVVERLRASGAILLGKTNLDELQVGAEGLSTARGQTHNPYGRDYLPGGSSSGTGAGVSSSFAAAGIGADTNGSIRTPSAWMGLCGLRPTMGLVSRRGAMPGTYTTDVLGPMARSMDDLALLLDVIAGEDAGDPVTARSEDRLPVNGFAAGLERDGLRGVRIGYYPHLQGFNPDGGDDPTIYSSRLQALAVADTVLVELEEAGAELVALPEPTDVVAALNEFRVATDGAGNGKANLLWQEYLARTTAPVRTLAELLDAGEATLFRDHTPFHRAKNLAGMMVKRDAARNLAAENAWDGAQLAFHGAFESYLAANDVDVIVFLPGNAVPRFDRNSVLGFEVLLGNVTGSDELTQNVSSEGGLPQLQVPAGLTADKLPHSIGFLGAAFSDAELLRYGFAYEQATRHRRRPAP